MSAPRVSSQMPGTAVARSSSGRAPGMCAATSVRGSALDGDSGCAGSPIDAPHSASNTSNLLAIMKDFRHLWESSTSTAARGSAAAQCLIPRVSLACAPRQGRPRRRGSTAGMMLRVQLFETLARHVRVDLRRRKVTVPEQHLHDAQIGAVVQKVGSEGVAERVRRELLGDAGLARVTLDDVPEGLPRHAVAAPRREQVIGLPLEEDLAARAAAEFLEGAHGLLAERDETFPIALAEDADHTLVEVDLTLAQVHQLRYPQSRGVQHFEHGAVAVAERVTHRGRRQQRLDLLLRERARQ